MAQLKMYRFAGTTINDAPLPEGYTISTYKDESDKTAWCACCADGHLIDETAGAIALEKVASGCADGAPDPACAAAFDSRITEDENIDLCRDVYFLNYNGERVGTATTVLNGDVGTLHMVSIRRDFRGKGLAKYLNAATSKVFDAAGVRYSYLTTDEFRTGAVKSYLNGGYLPVEYAVGMQDRWEAVLETYGIESVQMLYEDTTPFKVIYRKSKAPRVTFGVVGARRGSTMMNYCRNFDNARLVAICDCDEKVLNDKKAEYGEDGIAYFTDYDEFLKADMDCVVLANFANEHAPFAVKALKAGKNVLSEVLPVQNMAQAVELVETVEQTGKVYAYAENYCYMPAPRRIRELYREGKLGRFEYGEGEYMHNCEPGWPGLTYADPEHWRNTMSAFYYCTHSLGPLIHITGERPVSVTGFEGAYNDRMRRMCALGGPFGVEMVTLENGGIVKSVHGVGPSRNSIWYSVYGSKGRAESSREDAEAGGVGTLYVNLDKNEGDNHFESRLEPDRDDLAQLAGGAGHGGSDFYVMFNMVQKLRGNRNADIVDVYEALDMFLPGMFAYRSVLAGGSPMSVPNLRNKNERDRWRGDTSCTSRKFCGGKYVPSYSKGNQDIPEENYRRMKELYENPAPREKKLPVMGIQLYTLRDHIQTAEDFDKTLARLERMGVTDVQISAIGEFPAYLQAAVLKEHDMKVCVTHKSFDRMLNDLDAMIEEHKIIGCDAMGVGSAPGEARGSAAAVADFIEKAQEIGRRLKKAGMTFNYHNHDFEFKTLDNGRTMMDMLIEDSDPELLHFIPDVMWIQYAGADPVKVLERMKGRVKVAHFKDYILDENGGRKFVSLGKGLVDLDACYEAACRLEIPYIMYEQDSDWTDGDAFRSVEESWAWMRSVDKNVKK